MNPPDHFRVSRPFCRLRTESKLFWTLRTTFCYHCQVSMVFKGTITIEWNGLGQPLGSMVFRWFWSQATISFNSFQWLSTIGSTIEWWHTIPEVYHLAYLQVFHLQASHLQVLCLVVGTIDINSELIAYHQLIKIIVLNYNYFNELMISNFSRI